uniref:Mitochondrial 2-oxodicarboxylate carrier n=1 Tax=Meloidogyne floridensis TaxID=298350 RepID=A0A915NGX5_9BILA
MEKVKEGGRQLIAGGTAGMIEVSLMHPLDLVKTRLQIGGRHYKGLLDCFGQIIKKEGPLGFYKGILPPILAETPKRAIKFATFDQYKSLLEPLQEFQVPLYARNSLAGLMSGITEAVSFVICPFEAVKVRLQSEMNVSLTQQKSAATMAGEIIKTNGLGTNGLYLGLGATLWRHAPTQQSSSQTNSSGSIPLRLGLGFISGSIASIANIPFDVAKSPQPKGKSRTYITTWQTISLIKREEGIAALYRGLLPKVMRLGPGGGIMLNLNQKRIIGPLLEKSRAFATKINIKEKLLKIGEDDEEEEGKYLIDRIRG